MLLSLHIFVISPVSCSWFLVSYLRYQKTWLIWFQKSQIYFDLFRVPTYELFLRIFNVQLRRMCIKLHVYEMFCINLLSSSGLKFYLRPLFPVFVILCQSDISIAISDKDLYYYVVILFFSLGLLIIPLYILVLPH